MTDKTLKTLKVLVCSPFRSTLESERRSNLRYLRLAILDSISRGEAPFAPHAFYPNYLDDSDPEDRELGLTFSRVYLMSSDLLAVYADRGVSPGMHLEISQATYYRIPIDVRYVRTRTGGLMRGRDNPNRNTTPERDPKP